MNNSNPNDDHFNIKNVSPSNTTFIIIQKNLFSFIVLIIVCLYKCVCECLLENNNHKTKHNNNATSKQHLCVRGPLRECRSIRSGASGLPYYCAPLVCISAVIGLLAVWRHNKSKTKNQNGHWWREVTGLTGDRVESKGASAGRPDLPVSVSPAACRARLSAIGSKNAHFAFLVIFWEVRKVAGLTGDRAEGKRASSGRPDLPVTVLLLPAARGRVPEQQKTRISHFSPFWHLVAHLACNEPCLLSTATCLLPPAAAACHIYCRRLLCENQARGRSGL